MDSFGDVYVSAVVPCYNNAAFVGEAVQSLLQQSRSPNEIIIVDDGSTDGSQEMLQELEQSNKIIKVFYNDRNRGIPYTRNRLIAELHPDSKYMVILDADDVAHPDRIKEQVSFLEDNSEYGLVGSAITVINDVGEVIGVREYPSAHNAIVRTALHFNPIAQSAVTIPTAVLRQVGVYDLKLRRVQDYDLWLRIMRAGYLVHSFQLPLTSFRRHASQGKETLGRLSLYYSWRVRSRYIWRAQFFSVKGFVIFLSYTVAILLPTDLMNYLYKTLFVKT